MLSRGVHLARIAAEVPQTAGCVRTLILEVYDVIISIVE